MDVGFIGTGNMGGAILSGYAKTNKEDTLYAFRRNTAALKEICEETGAKLCESIGDVVSACNIIFLGVKPNAFEEVMPIVAREYSDDKIVVSMAAGVSIEFIERYLGENARIIRIMPNTPAKVGMSMTSASRNKNVEDEAMEKVMAILNAIGDAEEVDEELIHCVIGVSGSSPAYTYMFIEGLVMAAVANGMDEAQARKFAATAVMGAAKMVLEEEESLEQLRVNVCSPGGTTIQAVNKLFDENFEEIIGEGFQAAVDRSKEMAK